jgi:hypothetical protein
MVTTPRGRARSIRNFRSDLAAEAAPDRQPADLLTLGVGILGRAALHAWRLGDMAEDEAVAFVDQITVQLLADLAADAPG